MGRKRKESPPIDQIYATVSRMLVPEHILKYGGVLQSMIKSYVSPIDIKECEIKSFEMVYQFLRKTTSFPESSSNTMP